MKRNLLLFCTTISIIVVTIFISCKASPQPKEHEFWEVNYDFDAPATWITHSYAEAFTIQIPPYMDEQSFVLSHNDNDTKMEKCTLNNKEYMANQNAFTCFKCKKDSVHNKYAYIKINYLKGNKGDFWVHVCNVDVVSNEFDMFCDNFIKSDLGTGKLITKRKRNIDFTKNGDMMVDICYQRVGNIDGEGPVTVHIFVLQNLDECVILVVSYHDKNKEMYKDLFNIVETFKWNNIKLPSVK